MECVPTSIELWIALANLESYEAAKVILNRAGKINPGNHMIWIHACKLEETKGNTQNIEIILSKALKILPKHGCNMSRAQWMKEAEQCEKDNYVNTAQVIVKLTMLMNLDVNERRAIWSENIKNLIEKGSLSCARTLVQEALKVMPKNKALWLNAYEIEKDHGTLESQEDTFKKIIQSLPGESLFYLMYAKHQWQAGFYDKCRSILKSSRESLPMNLDIWIASVKFERECKAFNDALNHCMNCKINDPRIFKHAIQLKRVLAHANSDILNEVNDALIKHPKYYKFYIIGCQMSEQLNDVNKCREYLNHGIEQCQKTEQGYKMFIYASNFERKHDIPKARTIMQEAKIFYPKNAEIWSESIKLEQCCGNDKIAKSLISKALQECQKSGILWSLAIDHEQAQQKKAKCQDAIKYCEDDENVMLSGAKIFIAENKIEKARKWIRRTILLNPQFGDGWAYYYYLESINGSKEILQDINESIKKAKPNKGELWRSISKQIQNTGIGSLEVLKRVVAIIQAKEIVPK